MISRGLYAAWSRDQQAAQAFKLCKDAYNVSTSNLANVW